MRREGPEVPAGQQQPESADQQIRSEITATTISEGVAGLFGTDHRPTAAGAGGTGEWVFTNLDQLDGLIAGWTAVRTSIDNRLDTIERAENLVEPPADDLMSVSHSTALKESLETMKRHAASMHTYADAYVNKLVAARSRYLAVENRNTGRFADSDGG